MIGLDASNAVLDLRQVRHQHRRRRLSSGVRWSARVKAGKATIDGVSIGDKAQAAKWGRELADVRASITVDAIHAALAAAPRPLSRLRYHAREPLEFSCPRSRGRRTSGAGRVSWIS